jgi:hypothetical protein
MPFNPTVVHALSQMIRDRSFETNKIASEFVRRWITVEVDEFFFKKKPTTINIQIKNHNINNHTHIYNNNADQNRE